MHKLISLRTGWATAIFIVINTICAGLGMGVPILNILFGFTVGWYQARRIITQPVNNMKQALGKAMQGAAFTSGYTFLLMAVIWAHCVFMLFDPAADLAHYGIPQILYEPQASFIGWLVLMVIISPFLQFLMTLFGCCLTLRFSSSSEKILKL